MPSVELRIPPDPAYVGLARLVVAQAARQAGVPQDRVEDVKIAVDEALANAVRGQAALGSSAPIDLAFGATDLGFEVVVRALEGPATDADSADQPGPDLLDPKLSLTLIEGLTDDMSYEPEGGTVSLRFVIGLG
jgi:serine/threonine-protein kinase RsbW